MGVPTDPLKEVMILGVSRGGPTNPVGEVMFFLCLTGPAEGGRGGQFVKVLNFCDRQTNKKTLHHNIYVVTINHIANDITIFIHSVCFSGS